MNLHTDPWKDHNGASHRKNLDTPSLAGSCWSALRHPRQNRRKQKAYNSQDAPECFAALEGALIFEE
jgi:hypothetical protein